MDNKEYISIKNLTKDYGERKGIFDINLSVKKGEVFGLVGINGSGKTTLIRHLMGFLSPDKGYASINNQDCWTKASFIKQKTGYVPGEIAFPDAKTGTDFLKVQESYLKMKDHSYSKTIINKLELDINANLKRMSKGMKQKTAIVNAFMNNPEVLLLDEPTTGLDPLMQQTFVELILEEKKKRNYYFYE